MPFNYGKTTKGTFLIQIQWTRAVRGIAQYCQNINLVSKCLLPKQFKQSRQRGI